MTDIKCQKQTSKELNNKIFGWAMFSLWIGVFFGFGVMFGTDLYFDFKALSTLFLDMVFRG